MFWKRILSFRDSDKQNTINIHMVISTKMHINIKLEMCEGVFDKKVWACARQWNETVEERERNKKSHSLSIRSERLYKHVMLRLSLIMRLLHIFFHLQLLIWHLNMFGRVCFIMAFSLFTIEMINKITCNFWN